MGARFTDGEVVWSSQGRAPLQSGSWRVPTLTPKPQERTEAGCMLESKEDATGVSDRSWIHGSQLQRTVSLARRWELVEAGLAILGLQSWEKLTSSPSDSCRWSTGWLGPSLPRDADMHQM